MKLEYRAKESLREFYLRLKQVGPQWHTIAGAMISLLDELERRPTDDSYRVFTSHQILVFGDPDTSERNVLVSAGVDGVFSIEYTLAETEQPWRSVTGVAGDVTEAADMVQLALRAYGHRLLGWAVQSELSDSTDG